MVSYERLVHEHDMLCNVAAAVEHALAAGPAAIGEALAERDILCALLDHHLSQEDSEIYPRLMACGDGKTELIARQFAAEYSTLETDWKAYLVHWTPTVARGNWFEFQRETRDILCRLRRRIEDENALLYPAALGASVIAFRERVAA